MKRALTVILAVFLLAALLASTALADAGLQNFTEKTPYNGRFTDVPQNAWYYENVAKATSFGLIHGMTETTFEPDSNITREQMVTMLYRYANRVVPTKTSASLAAFTDASSVSDWALPSMQWAVGVGVIGGMGDGTINPQGNTTRAQIARVMQQFCEIKAGIVA
jgi:Spy/CpxP family protein refolding chaperone